MEFKQFSLGLNDTKVHQFVDYLAEGKVMATKCNQCGTVYYPPIADCADCCSSDMDWVEVDSEGKLATFTMVHVAPDHYYKGEEERIPFSKYSYRPCPIGILEMANGVKVMGWIPDIPSNDIKIGMTLKARGETLKDGKITITLRA